MNWYHSDIKISVSLIFIDVLYELFVYNEHLGDQNFSHLL